ncbi:MULTISPECIES: hypothetical protein [unclassified Clostridium]|nr:hypothetical protein [Clostridium sp.]
MKSYQLINYKIFTFVISSYKYFINLLRKNNNEAAAKFITVTLTI